MKDKGITPSCGIEMREAHYPGRAPVEAYGNGGFRFADMSHRGPILCLPDGIYAWHVSRVNELEVQHFQRVFDGGDIEVFLLGLGPEFCVISPEIRSVFQANSIVAEPMSTGAAVRTYNVLLAENRAVGCGLFPVE